MARVLIYPIAYGLGPTGKAIAIAHHISRGHQVTLLSFGHAVPALRRSIADCGVHEIIGRDFRALDGLIGDDFDAFISIMDLEAALRVKKQNPEVFVIFVDSLLHWRLSHYPRTYLEQASTLDAYVSQWFPGQSPNGGSPLELLRPDRFFEVGPIVDPPGKAPPSNDASETLLVHYGGVCSPVLDFRHYLPFLSSVTKTLLDAYSSSYGITFTGSGEFIELLSPISGGSSTCNFECLSYAEFQRNISKARLVVTTPGVETLYETFSKQTPIVFLPPTNSTQLTQMNSLVQYGFQCSITPRQWSRMLEIEGKGCSYQEKTRLLAAELLAIGADPSFAAAICDDVALILHSSDHRERRLHRQDGFLPSGLADGLATIRGVIESI